MASIDRPESEQRAARRSPLRVMFVITSMPVGGAETLLMNLVRRMDRQRFAPMICCLKEPGPLGEILRSEIPVFHHLLSGKYDLRVMPRLVRLMRRQRIDAVVTVGAGDKMFWGRLAAWRAGVPVILSALHSTGWPDCVGRLNRLLTPLTGGFIGVADEHGRYLVEQERFPAPKVFIIPNGVDVARFAQPVDRAQVRKQLDLAADAPIAGIVAALRPEKNHELLLRATATVCRQVPQARLLIIGDGPERPHLEKLAIQLELSKAVRFLGNRDDIPQLLGATDIFLLTSRMEANPVSILEAMAAGKPVIAPRVGSIPEVVIDGETGYLTDPGDVSQVAESWLRLARHPEKAANMGETGRRRVVSRWSLDVMVEGYERLITELYETRTGQSVTDHLGLAESLDTAELVAAGA